MVVENISVSPPTANSNVNKEEICKETCNENPAWDSYIIINEVPICNITEKPCLLVGVKVEEI